jgi:hypothetical protein
VTEAVHRFSLYIAFLTGAVVGFLMPASGFPPMDGFDRTKGGPQEGDPP